MENSPKDEFIESILKSEELTKEEKEKVIQKYKESDEKVHLLFLGKTGVGKSSTINALFDTQKAEVGKFVKSTTKEITKYKFGDNLFIYDSPGIGEPGKDKKNKKDIIDYLNKKDENGKPLIDMAIFILDANDIAYEESINFINKDLSPILEDKKRLIIAINKIDQIYGGLLFDKKKNMPTKDLEDFMGKKLNEIKKHLKEEYDIIYYCAGFQYKDFEIKPYNIKELLKHIVKNFSLGKRVVTFNWERVKEISLECMGYAGLAAGGAVLGGYGLLAAWKSYLFAKALLSAVTFEKIFIFSNYLYFLSSLIVDGGKDYMENQKFWNEDLPTAINEMSELKDWFKDKLSSSDTNKIKKQNIDDLYKNFYSKKK